MQQSERLLTKLEQSSSHSRRLRMASSRECRLALIISLQRKVLNRKKYLDTWHGGQKTTTWQSLTGLETVEGYKL